MMALWSGCQQAPPAAPPGGIQYKVAAGAQITQVNLYAKPWEGLPATWVDVGIRNASNAPKEFRVVVKVDNEPVYSTTTAKKIEPGKDGKVTFSTAAKPLPTMVSITVSEAE